MKSSPKPDSGDKALSQMRKAMAASQSSGAEAMANLFSMNTRPVSAEAQQRAKAKARRGGLKQF